jgi:hypothetical protein
MNAVDIAARGLAARALDMRAPSFATRSDAAAAASVPPVGATFATEGGVIAGDGGAACYRVVAQEPAHPGKIALADGLWGEILGPVLPVEAFGAVGDCPDVTRMGGYNPATAQGREAIATAITSATNDAQAFQDAFRTATAIGGATVTYGHGKRYRIAFDHRGVLALVVGDNTTFRRVGGGWLEFDPSLLTGQRQSYEGLPPKRSWPDSGITTGDPDTGLITATALLEGTANVVPADQGLDESDFTHNVHFRDIDIRCHTRSFWHALADFLDPEMHRLRLYGFYLRMAAGATFENCYVKGVPNDGINVTGGRDVTIVGCVTELCGYGAVDNAACNGLSAIGYVVQGRPDLSGQNFTIKRFTSRFAKDEGVAYAGIKGLFIDTITSIGDHDRAVEGIDGYAMSETSATLGQDIANDVVIGNVSQDGRHVVSTGSIALGSTTLVLDDAFYLSSGGSNGRYVFIPGAGPGGGDGPFLIAAVDYAANTATLATPASAAVAGVACYVHSRVAVTASDGNEGRVTLRGMRARNVFSTYHPIHLQSASGGRHRVEDVELENVVVPPNFAGVFLQGERVAADNVRFVGSVGAGNSAVVQTKATFADVTRIAADAGFQHAVRAAEFSGPARRFTVRDCEIEGVNASPVFLDFAAKCDRISIEGNTFLGTNASADPTAGLIYINRPALISCDRLTLKGNTVRWAGRQSAYPITTSGAALPAGAFAVGVVVENDLMDPEHFAPGFTTLRIYNNFGRAFAQLISRRNTLPGSRTMNVAAIPPTAGRWYQGDEVRVEFPVAGGAERARCTIGGSHGSLYAGDGAAPVTVAGAVSGSTTVVVSDSTNIEPNDTLLFAGAFVRAILWVDRATHTLTLSAALTAADGASVAFGVPVFKTCAALAA